MNPDGWITIGTKLDSKQLERDIKRAETNLKKFERQMSQLTEKEARIKAKIEIDQQDYKEKVRQLNQKQQGEYKANSKFGYVVGQEQIDIKYDELRKRLDDAHAKKLDESNLALEEINKKMQENTKEQTRLNNKIQEANTELNKTKGNFDLSGKIESIGSSISKVTKKVMRWGLAVFGVRSAYYFVRQAMSTLSGYNEELANKISSIRLVLAVGLEPVILKIVGLVETILNYVNYLTKAWFGLDLFARAGELSAKGMSSGLKSGVKNAKELKKQLAGFDEMEILQDNSSNDTAGGYGGSSGSNPFNLKEIKIPKWLEWIKDHGEEIKKIIIGIGLALAAIKFAELLTWAGELTGLLGGLLQIGIIAIGVELLYTALTGRELISDIMEIKKGLEDLNKIRKEQNKQAKASQESTKKMIKTYNDVAESTGVTREQTELYINTLLNGVKSNEDLIQSMEKQKDWLGALTGGNKKLNETQKEYNKTIEIQMSELKKLYDRGELNNKQKAIYQSLLEKNIGKLQETNANLNKNSEEYRKNTEKIKETKTELERITGRNYEIKTSIQTPNTNAFENSIRNLLNKVSNWFSNFGELKIGFGWGSGGGGFRAKGGIYYPKLASGGIINMPGRGVPYHGATIGERGAEAVVPLTDSQQMALLGEAIGKYITVNATIVNSMNGRVLNRELQRVQNQTSFATNGR